jgi:hypothetical protein
MGGYGNRSSRAPRDSGEILCERCAADRRNWGQRLRPHRIRDDVGERVAPPVVLPAWMSDPSLLPKRPPGGRA